MANWYGTVLTIQNTCPSFKIIKEIFFQGLPEKFHTPAIITTPIFEEQEINDITIGDLYFQPKSIASDLDPIDLKEHVNLTQNGVRLLRDWEIRERGATFLVRNRGVSYSNAEAFQIFFETTWSPPIGVFKQIIAEHPNLSIFISMQSWESQSAGWICKLPWMSNYEFGFSYLERADEGEEYLKPIMGGLRFVELATHFRDAAHCIFLDAPKTSNS